MKSSVPLKVAGVVVLYNSQLTVLNNIKSYIGQIEKLFVIDNSEFTNRDLNDSLNSFPTITYISNGRNEGIAKALNIAANRAINEGYDYLLTMDDDTSIPSNMVSVMLSFVEKNPEDSIGIIAPQSVLELVNDSYTSVFFCITSGNLLNLQAYAKCGPFLDELFIDWVDHEFCLRVIKNGFSIIQLNQMYIQHSLGTKKNTTIAGYTVNWVSHSPIRVYYKIRNTLYVLKNHAHNIPLKYHIVFAKDFFKEIIKNIFLEDQRFRRAILILKAVRDFYNNKMGSYFEV